jgi:hypothetical protein
MAGTFPAGVVSGQIYCHDRYYFDGGWRRKYFLVLAASPSGDVVHRLLTSRAHSRPRNPPCFHGDPYPGFYLGYLGGELTSESWLDLRGLDDYDGLDFANHRTKGSLILVQMLDKSLLCSALDCAAGADDTTRQQEQSIRDQRAILGCP